MANYNKSFNFRNGIQVDNDNFVVNANGLVGIGTTIPKNYILNVQGDVSVSGLITASNLTIEDITADNLNTENVSASSSITAATFYGSAAGLTGIAAVAVDGWYITGGNISTTSNVGIGTDLPSGDLQVGIGVTINGDGNATYVGVITANSFNGSGSNITNINASNISSGTLSNSRLPSNINVSGVVTAYAFSGFGTNLTNINASNISSGTLSNSRLPSNVNLSGVVTAYAFSGFGTNITNINASNISSGTLSNSRLPSNINVSGVVTASNFDGIASTAQSITGSPNITVTNITASNSNVSGVSTVSTTTHVGSGGTAFAALNSGRIGVGTAIPTSEIQVRKSAETLLEVVSDTSQARISIGQSVGVGKSTGVLRFGSTSKNFDILNNDTGNINMYLHAGSAGIDTGRFAWLYGQNNTELVSLTYTGNFGIGITNPTNNLHVVGTSLVTGNATFESNVTITGNLTAGTINLPSLLNNTNINNVSGVSTFYGLNVTNNFTVAAGSSIGIATATPIVDLDARGKTGLFASLGIGTASTNQTLKVTGSTLLQSVAIGNTSVDDGSGLGIFGGTTTLSSNSVSGINSTVVVLDSTCAIGVGTTSYRAAVDLSGAGKNHFGGIGAYMIVPILNSTEIAGITTFEGALIFNTTTKKFQGYTGTAWVDFH